MTPPLLHRGGIVQEHRPKRVLENTVLDGVVCTEQLQSAMPNACLTSKANTAKARLGVA